MKITFKEVRPNLKSINCELIFLFEMSEIRMDELPLQIEGELYLSDGVKVGDLRNSSVKTMAPLWLNAEGASDIRANSHANYEFTCMLSAKAINYIENIRTGKNNLTKSVVFSANLTIQILESRVAVGNILLDERLINDDYSLRYRYTENYRPARSNMWLLSSNGGPQFIGENWNSRTFEIKIDLMDWVNTFTKYLNIGTYIVYEFIQPEVLIDSTKVTERYNKAQRTIKEMETSYHCRQTSV